jgi:transposase
MGRKKKDSALLERIAALEAELLQLRKEVARLEEEKARLETENAELRRRLAKDSHNSHKPPSSDGYRKKPRRTSAMPKGPKRKRGGQAGHKGRTLRQVSQPDKVQVHLPHHCAVCGREIQRDEAYQVVGKRQVFDLPEPKLEVTEHQLGEITCCGVPQRGAYPETVKAVVQYGPGVRALVTQLAVAHSMPLGQISQLFADLYGYELNERTIENALEIGYKLTEPVEEEIKAALEKSKVGHFDETGTRVNGHLQWLHVASDAQYTYLFTHEKRGRKAMKSEASILPNFHGWAIHDRLRSYFTFEEAKHGLCNAHILRDLQGVIEEGRQWASAMREFLLELHSCGEVLEGESAEEARQRYRAILSQAEAEEPPPKKRKGQRGRAKNSPGRNLMRSLQKYEDSVLAFAFVAEVPFTNNQAERDLRAVKVKQKVSGSFRTEHGAARYARLQGMISTCRKQERPVFHTLRALFAHQPVSLVAGNG